MDGQKGKVFFSKRGSGEKITNLSALPANYKDTVKSEEGPFAPPTALWDWSDQVSIP